MSLTRTGVNTNGIGVKLQGVEFLNSTSMHEIDVTITDKGDDLLLSVRRYDQRDPLTDIDTFHADKKGYCHNI